VIRRQRLPNDPVVDDVDVLSCLRQLTEQEHDDNTDQHHGDPLLIATLTILLTTQQTASRRAIALSRFAHHLTPLSSSDHDLLNIRPVQLTYEIKIEIIRPMSVIQ